MAEFSGAARVGPLLLHRSHGEIVHNASAYSETSGQQGSTAHATDGSADVEIGEAAAGKTNL